MKEDLNDLLVKMRRLAGMIDWRGSAAGGDDLLEDLTSHELVRRRGGRKEGGGVDDDGLRKTIGGVSLGVGGNDAERKTRK